MSTEAARRALLSGVLPTNPTPRPNPADTKPRPRGDTVNSKERRAARRRHEREFLKTLRQMQIGDVVLMPDGEICIFAGYVGDGAAQMKRPEGRPTTTRLVSLDTPVEPRRHEDFDRQAASGDTRTDGEILLSVSEHAAPETTTEAEPEEGQADTHGDTMSTRPTKDRQAWTKADDLDLLANVKALLARGFYGSDLWKRTGRMMDRTEASTCSRIGILFGTTKRKEVTEHIDDAIAIIMADLDLSTVPDQTKRIIDGIEPASPTEAPITKRTAERKGHSYTRREEVEILRAAIEIKKTGNAVWGEMSERFGRSAYALRRKVTNLCGTTQLADMQRTLKNLERFPIEPFTLDDVPGPQKPAEAAEPSTQPESPTNGRAAPESVSEPAAPTPAPPASAYPVQVSTESPRVALLRDASAAGPEALKAIAAALVEGLS